MVVMISPLKTSHPFSCTEADLGDKNFYKQKQLQVKKQKREVLEMPNKNWISKYLLFH